MEKAITVIQVVAPIFVAIFLGMMAKRKQVLTAQEVRGLQQFVMNYGVPCVIFNSCLNANIGAESVSSMALVLPIMLLGTLWAFRARKKQFPYHNFPQLFAAQETGMLGIPLFMILFGADQAYRVGILDLTQAVTAFPTIAILSADAGENPSPAQIAKKVFSSPMLIMALLGLGLNLTGIAGWLTEIGVCGIITECTSFLAQPVSAMMIFCVGYNFSLEAGNRGAIFKISALHLIVFAAAGILVQLCLFLVPNVDALTRWALLLYFTLPASYITPSLGRTKDECVVGAGVCSLLTVTSLIVFCFMAVFAV